MDQFTNETPAVSVTKHLLPSLVSNVFHLISTVQLVFNIEIFEKTRRGWGGGGVVTTDRGVYYFTEHRKLIISIQVVRKLAYGHF